MTARKKAPDPAQEAPKGEERMPFNQALKRVWSAPPAPKTKKVENKKTGR